MPPKLVHDFAFPESLLVARVAGAGADGGRRGLGTPGASDAPGAEPAPVRKAFVPRQACHPFEKGASMLIGPNLHPVFGRRGRPIEGYRYPVGLEQFGKDGHVWSGQTIRSWPTHPRAMEPEIAARCRFAEADPPAGRSQHRSASRQDAACL